MFVQLARVFSILSLEFAPALMTQTAHHQMESVNSATIAKLYIIHHPIRFVLLLPIA
jgi:hypothetical protein